MLNSFKSKSISSSCSNSIFNNSSSHSAYSEVLLSAILKAFICVSVKSSITIQGTSFNPNFLDANNLVWPFTTTLFLSINIGFLKPNSAILEATLSTAFSLFLGLFI